MKENIKKLKELAIARQCALEFDYCPEKTEANYILENLQVGTKDYIQLRNILDQYNGWSPSNIEDEIIDIIEKM